jgi:type IV secretory pathway VirB10-like protein
VNSSAHGRGRPQVKARRGGLVGRFKPKTKPQQMASVAILGIVAVWGAYKVGGGPPVVQTRQAGIGTENFKPHIQEVALRTPDPAVPQPLQASAPPPPAPPPPETPQNDPPMPERSAGTRGVTAARPPAPVASIGFQVQKRRRSEATAEQGAGRSVATAPEQDRAQGTRIAYKEENIVGSRAGSAIDTSLMMRPGLYALILDTAVNSERAGPFFAHFKHDVKSRSGVTLIPAGTDVTGTYESEVGEGQERIVSIAVEGIADVGNGQGIPFKIGSPIGDEQGRNGMPGHVDNKTWPKLRRAAILMLTQGAIQAANTALQAYLSRGSGNNITSFNMGGGGMGSALAGALGAGGNVQAVITKDIGEEIAVLLTHPIIFDRSYYLETINPQAREARR